MRKRKIAVAAAPSNMTEVQRAIIMAKLRVALKHLDPAKRYQTIRRAMGLCIRCGQRPLDGKALCTECKAKARERERRRLGTKKILKKTPEGLSEAQKLTQDALKVLSPSELKLLHRNT